MALIELLEERERLLAFELYDDIVDVEQLIAAEVLKEAP